MTRFCMKMKKCKERIKLIDIYNRIRSKEYNRQREAS